MNKAEATKQSQSKLPQTKTQARNHEADFSDSTKPTQTYASKENTAEKSRELARRGLCQNLLAEKLLTKTAYLKSATVKNKLIL
jgi:hypothetical protein